MMGRTFVSGIQFHLERKRMSTGFPGLRGPAATSVRESAERGRSDKIDGTQGNPVLPGIVKQEIDPVVGKGFFETVDGQDDV